MNKKSLIQTLQDATTEDELEAVSQTISDAWIAEARELNERKSPTVVYGDKQIVIDNFILPCRRKSDAPRDLDRQEENLYHAMSAVENCRRLFPSALYDKYNLQGTDGVLAFLCDIFAPHYELESMAIYQAWMNHFGPGIIFPARADPRIKKLIEDGIIGADFPDWM